MPMPVAYLLRRVEHRNRPAHGNAHVGAIEYPHMFKRLDRAEAAAKRLSNSWKTMVVVPVYELEDVE